MKGFQLDIALYASRTFDKSLLQKIDPTQMSFWCRVPIISEHISMDAIVLCHCTIIIILPSSLLSSESLSDSLLLELQLFV